MENSIFDLFDGGFVEPKSEERAALIASLHSGNYRLSFSSLSAFAISPRAFIAYKLQERKETKAMVMGEAVHCLVLEPELFNDRFFVAPDVNGATKEGKSTWHKIYCDFVGDVPVDEFKMKIDDIISAIKESTGVTVLPGASEKEARSRATALVKNRACRSILDKITQTEIKLPDGFSIGGINFTGRIDGRGDGVIIDIKNVPDATIHKAVGSIWSRRLNWQMYAYDAAFGFGHACSILCVDGAFETSAHTFSESHLMSAERQILKYVQQFKKAVFESQFDDGVWDMSQDFWLRSDMNEFGVNYL